MTTDPQWTPCEPGTLQNIQQSSPTRTGQLTRRGATAAVVALVAGGGLLWIRDDPPGGVTCAEVKRAAQDYVDELLPAEQSRQIDAHRQQCSSCDTVLTRLEAAKDKVV